MIRFPTLKTVKRGVEALCNVLLGRIERLIKMEFGRIHLENFFPNWKACLRGSEHKDEMAVKWALSRAGSFKTNVDGRQAGFNQQWGDLTMIKGSV